VGNSSKQGDKRMGTCNLTAVYLNGELKIAQYGQFDGYPSGQGVTALSFLSSKNNVESLKESLARVRFIEFEGRDKEFIQSYDRNSPEFMSSPDNRSPQQKHWHDTFIHRSRAAGILANVADSNDGEILLKNSIDFAYEGLFCEWAYIIDLDSNTFEAFKGYNKTPVTEGRFLSSGIKEENGYHPVVIKKSYSLDQLPSEKEFLAELEPELELK